MGKLIHMDALEFFIDYTIKELWNGGTLVVEIGNRHYAYHIFNQQISVEFGHIKAQSLRYLVVYFTKDDIVKINKFISDKIRTSLYSTLIRVYVVPGTYNGRNL